MAEASHRLHQPQVGAVADVIHLPTSLSSDEVRFAVVVLAQRAARGAVKRQLQHGVSLLSYSEISSRAKELQCQLFVVFFRNRYFWERLTMNIGIVLVFAAFYLQIPQASMNQAR